MKSLGEQGIQPARGRHIRGGVPSDVRDELTVEGALQISINGKPFTVTMQTPGEERALVRGLLFTEGVVTRQDAPIDWQEQRDEAKGHILRLNAQIPGEFIEQDFEGRRSLMATSSCGLCGARDARDIEMTGCPFRLQPGERMAMSHVPAMIAEMAQHQPIFDATGGCHAAAAFTIGGDLLAAMEDIGRHNAADKVIGRLLEERRLEAARCLTVSGRLSYEILTKAHRAGMPFVLAVSALSSLAVEQADRFGMTVIGFTRGDRATVYSHPENVEGA